MAFSRSQQHGWNPKATLFTLFTSLVLLSWIYTAARRDERIEAYTHIYIPRRTALVVVGVLLVENIHKPHQHYMARVFLRENSYSQYTRHGNLL